MEIISRKEAKSQGLKFYFTGKRCKSGHLSQRYIVGTCVHCLKERYENDKAAINKRKKELYIENIDENRMKAREKYWADPEKSRTKNRNQYNKDIKKSREYQRDKYWKDPESHREYERNYRIDNIERKHELDKLSRERNKDNIYFHVEKRKKAKKLRTPLLQSEEEKKKVASIYREARSLTKETGVEHHVDFVIPLQNDYVSGLHVPSNMQVMTAEENLRKYNKFNIEEYNTKYHGGN